jgi:hypothetical protein
MIKSLRSVFFFLFISFCSPCFSIQPIVPCEYNRSDLRAGDVAICMMFQNEARFIKEWIEYHKTIGVSHFYLYNNASTDNSDAVLMPYVLSGEAELYYLKERTHNVEAHNKLQRAVYNHAVKLAKGKNEWLAIIDSDEFICMPHNDNIGEFLKSYTYAGGLKINWVMYGSSGIEELGPSELQIENFLYRTPDDWKENFNFKSIVRPAKVKKAGVHDSSYRKGCKAVFANHESKIKNPSIDAIRLNHYWWRDEKYFREVKLPRRSGWLTNYSDEEIEEMRQTYNRVYDPSMLPFVELTRKNM